MLRDARLLALLASSVVCGCGSSGGSGGPGDAGGSGGPQDAGGGTDAGVSPPADGPAADGSPGADTGGPPACSLPADGGTGDHGLTLLYAPTSFGAFLDHGALAGGYVYFTEDGNIKRVPTGGGAAEDLGALSAGAFLVVGNDLVYSSGTGPGGGWRIVEAALDEDAAAGTVLAPDVQFPKPMASDGTYVAWANANSAGVFSVALAGGSVGTIATGGQTAGLAVIGSNLYWADLSTMHVMFAPIAGGTPMQAAPISFDGEAAADGTAFYWADSSDGTINRMPAGSTTSRTIYTAPGFGEGPDHIAVNGDSVFFTEGFVGGSVWRVGTDGTGAAQLACGFMAPSAVFADATYVYVVSDSGVFRVDR